MRASVTFEVSKYELLRQRLLSEYPTIDEETLADTLEGITDLHEMIAAVIRSALVDEALHAGLRFRLDDMTRTALAARVKGQQEARARRPRLDCADGAEPAAAVKTRDRGGRGFCGGRRHGAGAVGGYEGGRRRRDLRHFLPPVWRAAARAKA